MMSPSLQCRSSATSAFTLTMTCPCGHIFSERCHVASLSSASDPPIGACSHVSNALVAYSMCCLQSVLNASTRLIFSTKCTNHISDALISLHWLRVLERIQYKIAVLTYKVVRSTAPRYLGPLIHVADVPGRRCLRSAHTNRLVVLTIKLSTTGSRALPVPPRRSECTARRRNIDIDSVVIPAAAEDSSVQTVFL